MLGIGGIGESGSDHDKSRRRRCLMSFRPRFLLGCGDFLDCFFGCKNILPSRHPRSDISDHLSECRLLLW